MGWIVISRVSIGCRFLFQNERSLRCKGVQTTPIPHTVRGNEPPAAPGRHQSKVDPDAVPVSLTTSRPARWIPVPIVSSKTENSPIAGAYANICETRSWHRTLVETVSAETIIALQNLT